MNRTPHLLICKALNYKVIRKDLGKKPKTLLQLVEITDARLTLNPFPEFSTHEVIL